MAIGYTEIDFLNGSAPALNATNLNKMDEAIKDACDLLDAETTAGRALVEAADADAQRTALGLGDSATLDVGTGAGDVAAGNAPAGAVTTHESTYAHANLPTADEKTRLGDIQAASGATTALKLANLTSPATPTQQGVALLGASGGAPELTKMPNGAAAVYSKDAFVAGDIGAPGWEAAGGTFTTGATLKFTVNAGTPNAKIALSGSAYKTLVLRIKSNVPWALKSYDGSVTYYTIPTNTQYAVYTFLLSAINGIQLYKSSSTTGDWFEIDWLWIGDYSYLTGTLSEEAARIADQLGDTAGVAAKAQATLTSTGTAPSDGDIVTIGGKAYTFKTVLGTTEGQVLIGADAAAALDNLKTAVNSTGVDAVQYCAAINPLVEATTNTDTTQLFEARTAGLLGNQITVAESSSQLSFANPAGGTTTLSGGKDAAGDKIKAQLNAAIGAGAAVGAIPTKTATSIIGYFAVADCASGAQVTLPAGGTWAWEVTTYGATYNSVKSGTAAGGAAISGTASANLCMRYERIA